MNSELTDIESLTKSLPLIESKFKVKTVLLFLLYVALLEKGTILKAIISIVFVQRKQRQIPDVFRPLLGSNT